MTTKDEVRSTVEALKLALTLALEALEETRNALAWFYDSYPQDVTKKGNELLPHVETVLTTIRAALASKSEALASEANEQPAPVAEPHKQQELSSASVEPVAVYVGETWCGSVVRLYEDLPLETPLYTSSQPRGEATLSQRSVKPWVPLTEFDIDQIPYSCSHADSRLIAYAIEAKLKEKNGF